MKLTRALTLVFLLFLGWPALCRASVADSLEAIAATLPDTQRVRMYREWTGSLQPGQAIAIGRKGISWAIDKDEKRLAADLLSKIGRAYFVLGDYPLALDCHQKAAKVYLEIGERKEMGMERCNMGLVLKRIKEPEKAEDEFRQALEIFRQLKDSASLATIYNHMGNLYEDQKNDLETALWCYNKSLSYSRPAGDIASVAYSLDFISGIYSKQGKYDEALRLLNEELAIRRSKMDDLFGEAINLNNIGEVYKMQDNITEAEKYFLQALDIAKGVGYKELIAHIYTMLAETSSARKDFAKAYGYMELRSTMRDSLISEKKNYQIAEIREKYESEKKEQQIVTLEKETELSNQRAVNLRNYFISAVLVLVLGGVIGWLYYNQQQQRKLSRERIAQEQLRTRAIIEAEEKERIRIARELHDGVGQLLAAAKMNLSSENGMENKRENVIRLVDDAIGEVRSVSHSMMPDVLMKHGLAKAIRDLVEKTSGSVTEISLQLNGWEKRWDAASESILYRVVQELIGNALKHAGATKINIDLNKFDDEINLIVEDNGKGFDPAELGERAGIGLKNMQSRIAFLGGHIIIDSTPGRGTTVIIAVPLNEQKTKV
jgi:signal transduction histidine kinase